jgi:predicted metalloprotease with PDZ domain
MLWVSEGFTSYYEYILLRRAGITTQDEILDSLHKHIATCENSAGHLFQSVTEASYLSWDQGQGTGGRRADAGVSKTVSYYEKGPVLGLLLDFKIRHETKNARSLDTVMRALYQRYFKDEKRGWTDEEFQNVCQETAGAPLQEIFDYAATTKDVDYNKYLGYAGLQLEPGVELTNAYFGGVIEERDGQLTVAATEYNSPARAAGLVSGDEIKSLNGAKVDGKALNEAVTAAKPGDIFKLSLAHGGQTREVEIELAHKMKRSYRILPIENPDPLQAAILQTWQTSK